MLPGEIDGKNYHGRKWPKEDAGLAVGELMINASISSIADFVKSGFSSDMASGVVERASKCFHCLPESGLTHCECCCRILHQKSPYLRHHHLHSNHNLLPPN
jgi:hypothetical protein